MRKIRVAKKADPARFLESGRVKRLAPPAPSLWRVSLQAGAFRPASARGLVRFIPERADPHARRRASPRLFESVRGRFVGAGNGEGFPVRFRLNGFRGPVCPDHNGVRPLPTPPRFAGSFTQNRSLQTTVTSIAKRYTRMIFMRACRSPNE